MKDISEPIIFVVGPTASGKTALGIELAKQIGGEIICADSRTVYKYLDIGTAKPDAQERACAPHHLLDVVDPDHDFTVVDFITLSKKAISEIRQRGKVPIFVGGSGLYVDSMLYGYTFGPKADPALREALQGQTIEDLQRECREKNIVLPENSRNKRYLQRAIESGNYNNNDRAEYALNAVVVGITASRDVLRSRILRRSDKMFKDGVVKEATEVAARFGWEHESMKGNMYRVVKEYLAGDRPYHALLEDFVRSDMRLAKRQMTWFKRNKKIIWSENPEELVLVVKQFIQKQ